MRNIFEKTSRISHLTASSLFKWAVLVLPVSAGLTMLVSCKDDKAYISGNLVSLPDGKVRLFNHENKLTVIDSTMSRDGRFTLEQPGSVPDLVFVGFDEFPDLLVPVILDGKEVYISGNLNYNDNITVSGTSANEDLRRHVSSIRGTDIMARAIELELEAIDPADDSVKYMMLARKRDSLRNMIARSRSEFVRDNPSSLVSAMFLSMALNDSMTLRQVDSLMNKLDSTIVDNAFSRRIRARMEKLAK